MTLGLPATIRAGLFDMDGVLTDTASTHARAWKETFDEFLRAARRRAARSTSVPTTRPTSTARPRYDGVRDFLRLARHRASRRASRTTRPDAETVARRRQPQERARAAADRRGGRDGLRRLRALRDEAARDAGLQDRGRVLERQHRADPRRGRASRDLFDARVDGVVIARRAPARASRRRTRSCAAPSCSGVAPAQAAVFEDALAGVEAGRAGGFGLVVGVDRHGRARRRCSSTAPTSSSSDLAELLE